MFTKCNEMKMLNLWNATDYHKMKRYVDHCSRNVTECLGRNNGMLQCDAQTDLGTYSS